MRGKLAVRGQGAIMIYTKGVSILYLATCNLHKAEELRFMLKDSPWEVRAAAELDPKIAWEETGETFAENARIKALAVRSYTSQAVLADDSGLCVDALKGAPGVYSSRFAGDDGNDAANIKKLLELIKDVPMEQRTARFVCSLVYIDMNGVEYLFEGKVEGAIAFAPRGNQGFGYDPVFVVGGADATMAELDPAAKNRLSHRFRALEQWRASFGRG